MCVLTARSQTPIHPRIHKSRDLFFLSIQLHLRVLRYTVQTKKSVGGMWPRENGTHVSFYFLFLQLVLVILDRFEANSL